MSQVKILGISGRAVAGKDTLSDHLYNNGFIDGKISIASTLKTVCIELFGVSLQDSYSNKDANSGIYVTTDTAKLINGLWDRVGTQFSVRELLQYFGTDVLRKFDNDCLIRSTLLKLKNHDDEIWAIPDVRFPNEVKAIQNAGGKVIRLTRNISNMTHLSEVALNNYNEFDLIYDNSTEPVDESMKTLTNILLELDWVSPRSKTLGST